MASSPHETARRRQNPAAAPQDRFQSGPEEHLSPDQAPAPVEPSKEAGPLPATGETSASFPPQRRRSVGAAGVFAILPVSRRAAVPSPRQRSPPPAFPWPLRFPLKQNGSSSRWEWRNRQTAKPVFPNAPARAGRGTCNGRTTRSSRFSSCDRAPAAPCFLRARC